MVFITPHQSFISDSGISSDYITFLALHALVGIFIGGFVPILMHYIAGKTSRNFSRKITLVFWISFLTIFVTNSIFYIFYSTNITQEYQNIIHTISLIDEKIDGFSSLDEKLLEFSPLFDLCKNFKNSSSVEIKTEIEIPCKLSFVFSKIGEIMNGSISLEHNILYTYVDPEKYKNTVGAVNAFFMTLGVLGVFYFCCVLLCCGRTPKYIHYVISNFVAWFMFTISLAIYIITSDVKNFLDELEVENILKVACQTTGDFSQYLKYIDNQEYLQFRAKAVQLFNNLWTSLSCLDIYQSIDFNLVNSLTSRTPTIILSLSIVSGILVSLAILSIIDTIYRGNLEYTNFGEEAGTTSELV